MKKIHYTKNYRRNLILYWRQWYPDWTIPIGYHVHHIKPKGLFKNKKDPGIHHPRNLIALHPDDHISIHKCRGDKAIGNFIIVAGARKDQPVSTETRLKMSKSRKGWRMPDWQKENLSIFFKNRFVSDATKRKMGIAQTGINSPHFTGYYKTLYGTFSGSSQQNILPCKTIIDWCKNSDNIISKRRYSHSKFLKELGEEIIGSSFKDIGFDFIRK